MEIINNGVIVADKCKFCHDIFSKTRGLMFSKPLKRGEARILVAKEESTLETTIHMFFVFFSIDVVWLNSKKEVVDVKRNIRMFTPLIKPRSPAKYVMELPKGMGKFFKVGDKVEFVE